MVRSEYLGVRVYVMAFFFFLFWEFSFGVLYLGGKMFLISGFEIQIGPYGPTQLTRTVSWDGSLNPKLVLHKKYSGPCELRLNLLGLRAVAGSHWSGWSKKKKKKKRRGRWCYVIFSVELWLFYLSSSPQIRKCVPKHTITKSTK